MEFFISSLDSSGPKSSVRKICRLRITVIASHRSLFHIAHCRVERLCDLICIGQDNITADCPVNLDRTGEVCHRVRVNSYAIYSDFLALYQRRSCTTERVQDDLGSVDPKPFDVRPDQMRRERLDEAVPIMDRAVIQAQLVLSR